MTTASPSSNRASIESQLVLILESAEFGRSDQSKRLLTYLVQHSLQDDHDTALKERAIGTALFGCEDGYDTNQNPIVRVRANDVRKRLSNYYREHQPSANIRFHIPAGRYRVEFQTIGSGTAADPVELSVLEEMPVPLTSSRLASRKGAVWFAALLLAVVALPGAVLWRFLSRPDAVEAFWQPALKSPARVILCAGHPVVYQLSKSFRQRNHLSSADHFRFLTEPVRLPPDTQMSLADVVAIPDQFVGLGSAAAITSLYGWLAKRDKAATLRFGDDVSFSELKGAPSVFIGAFQNHWTMDFTRDLRFVFQTREDVPGVLDRKTGKAWLLPDLKENGQTANDYVLISRIFHSQTGQFLVAAAGITQYGTQAAGEILTDTSLINAAIVGGGPGWSKRNLQMLYAVRVIGSSYTKPVLLVAHTWD